MFMSTAKERLFFNKGQSIIELLIAMGVFILSITAGLFLFVGGQSLSSDSVNSRLAADYGGEGIEAVRSIRNRSWDELAVGDHGLVEVSSQWQFSGTQDTKEGFTRKIIISDIGVSTKRITAQVSWFVEPQRSQTLELVEELTNWKGAIAGGCNSNPVSGDWTRPTVIGSADIAPSVSGTDVAVKLPYVFVSGISSTANKADLFVFDATNPASPNLIKSIDIGSGGINKIYIKDNYLYAASPNDSKEFIIFNISDPANTYELNSLNLSGSADGLSVAAFANTVAIGRSSSATYELVYIDVSNNNDPEIINQVATDGDVRAFYSTEQRLYFASQQSDSDVWTYDITNPTNPVFVGSYDIPGTTEDTAISVMEINGRTILDGNIEHELITIGATTTSQMYLRDRIDVGGDVNAITCVAGGLVFLATSNSNKEFYIVDASNPDDLKEYSYYNFPQNATGIAYDQNKVFLSVKSNNALKIITSSP